VLTGFTLPKLLWVRDHEPANFGRVRKMLLPKDYVRYRLTGVEPEGTAGGSSAAAGAAVLPASLIENWTVLVAERSWLLALELMVQPPERWDQEREALGAPFRTLSLF